ncbi:MAG: hypothetical protein JNK05_40365 [Myxococcales bacterium]|nr:hypothetical protein [Myxococcales bacterium]
MKNHRLLLAISLFVAGAQGCISMRGGGSSGSSGSGFTGTVSVENRSQLSICSLSTTQGGDRGTEQAVTLGPGQTVTFQAERPVSRILLTECSTNRLLYGTGLGYLNDRERLGGELLTVSKIVLLDPGANGGVAGDTLSIALAPRDANDALRDTFFAVMAQRQDDERTFMADSDLASQLLTLLQSSARRQGWREQFQSAVITWQDWGVVRERRQGTESFTMVPVARELSFVAGARWPDGHCTAQSFSARQAFDGENATGELGFGGIGAQLQIPCVLLDQMRSYPNAGNGE